MLWQIGRGKPICFYQHCQVFPPRFMIPPKQGSPFFPLSLPLNFFVAHFFSHRCSPLFLPILFKTNQSRFLFQNINSAIIQSNKFLFSSNSFPVTYSAVWGAQCDQRIPAFPPDGLPPFTDLHFTTWIPNICVFYLRLRPEAVMYVSLFFQASDWSQESGHPDAISFK